MRFARSREDDSEAPLGLDLVEYAELLSTGQDLAENAKAYKEKREKEEEKRRERRLGRLQRGGTR